MPDGVGEVWLQVALLSGATGRGHGMGEELGDVLAVLGEVGDAHARRQVQGLAGELPGAVEELHEARREAQDLG
jgi:hypothetical protein